MRLLNGPPNVFSGRTIQMWKLLSGSYYKGTLCRKFMKPFVKTSVFIQRAEIIQIGLSAKLHLSNSLYTTRATYLLHV